ncbi:MAG: M28 family peptidase [Chitinophagaceae bacterium]|nr:M28 family peptidase [Chitinophagaceae bacterium]
MKSFLTKYLFLFSFLLGACTASQKTAKVRNNTSMLDSLKANISYLADDRLEGRRAGTHGEELAMDYIQQKFQSIGLLPKGQNGFIQSFPIDDGKKIMAKTKLIIDSTSLRVEKDFFPFPYSPNDSLENDVSVALQEAETPWIYDLHDPLEENAKNPHFDLSAYIYENAQKAKEKGATAVFLYNTSSIDDGLKFEAKDKKEPLSIPVIYVAKNMAEKLFSNITATMHIKLVVEMKEQKRTGHNVIGYLDNGAPNTVILGAHFDHLGYGEDGNSMIRHFDHPMIHNGADDNASGTAALIQLARLLKKTKDLQKNYLFIAFSGEELGLFGSKYFTEHPTIDLHAVDYMINMDMVGRLNDSTNTLTVGGYGTSPAWGFYFTSLAVEGRAQTLYFKFDSSGTGPSDHTSFYRKNIPVLFYFTGIHADYHKPSDDVEKINFSGEEKIIQHIFSLVHYFDREPKIEFTKTREIQTSTRTSFKVTMGVMPDYTFSGSGLKIDGVLDNRPAKAAGLKAGDIVIQLGDFTISSMETYMKALGAMQKGETVTVLFLRDGKKEKTTLVF